MGWMPAPGGIVIRQSDGGQNVTGREKASMDEVTIIGLDLAKRVFQLHGARRDGSVAFQRKVSRSQLIPFLGKVSACIVAMVTLALAWAHACASRSKGRTNIETAGHG